MGQLRVVGCALWQPRPDFSREPVLCTPDAGLPPDGFVAAEPYVLDESIGAQATFGASRAAGPAILRIRVRAPVAEDGSDQPLARWETDEVVELLRALGLDSRLLAAAIDPTGLRRLRFRGVQAPFLMLDDQDAVRGFASLMFVPMAANVLVEIEHGRVLVDPAAPLDPLAFHAMDAHTVWTAFLGDAQGLAPALGLRALSTIDRGLRAISRRAIALEAGIAQAVTSGFSDAEDETRVRALTRELLATTGVTGAVAGRLAASRDAGAGDRGRTAINHPYDRCMSELERLMDAVASCATTSAPSPRPPRTRRRCSA